MKQVLTIILNLKIMFFIDEKHNFSLMGGSVTVPSISAMNNGTLPIVPKTEWVKCTFAE